MAVLFDARGNETAAPLDLLPGNTFTDVRTKSVTLGALNAESVTQLNGQTSVFYDVRTAAAVSLTYIFEGTVDGTNYFTVPAVNYLTQTVTPFLAIAAAQLYEVPCAGLFAVRCRISVYASGSVVVSSRASVGAVDQRLKAPFPTTLWVTATAAANTAATATLPAAGAGLFHYITHIDITRNATAALAGTATIIHTTTNLPGSPAWSVGNAMVAGGTEKDVFIDFAVPLKSSVANTATTVVAAAAGLAVLGRVNVGYYVGA
jgi:hypothetical protein